MNSCHTGVYISTILSLFIIIIYSCIRCWSLLLSAYEHTITFRNTQAHGNTSRLPLSVVKTESKMPPELVFLLEQSPVTAQHISVWTR